MNKQYLRDRRRLMLDAGCLAAFGALTGFSAEAVASAMFTDLGFANGKRPLAAFPGKRPLIVQTMRPPQLETPFSVFNSGVLTPNDAFFVRYHHANIPTSIEPATYRLNIAGSVKNPLSLTLKDLTTGFQPVELVAVNQCSGNSRGFSEPRVGGGQLGHGAMGNAKWVGVPLKAILDKAGVSGTAKQVTFRGLDSPVMPATPAFVKALGIDHARDGEVMVAYQMNGTDLPLLNGYPVRLVVPGYFGTYWVKHLSEINVVDQAFDGFYMAKAYRIPDTACACIEPGTTPKATVPIHRFGVRSFITSLENGAALRAGSPVLLKGIAFDGGSGIKEVSVSADGGKSWLPTKLGKDLGRYSFREWTMPLAPTKVGPVELMVRATAVGGDVQPLVAAWNPPGYMRNVVERTKVVVL